MKQIDKELVDGFCRAVLLDWHRHSMYVTNEKVRDYLLYEASYENVISLVCTGKSIKEDASSDMQISKYEEILSSLFSIGVSLFAAPPLLPHIQLLINKGFKIETQNAPLKSILSKKPITHHITGEIIYTTKQVAQKGGVAGKIVAATSGPVLPVLTYMGLFIGAGLVTKVLFAVIKKIVSNCRKNCKQIISKDIPKYRERLQICISKCKIADLNKVIPQLRREVQKCKKVSQNPEKCQHNIIAQISKFNDHLIKEKKRLKNAMENLKK